MNDATGVNRIVPAQARVLKMAAASCQLTQISPCFVGLKIQKEEIKVSDVGLQHPTEMTFR